MARKKYSKKSALNKRNKMMMKKNIKQIKTRQNKKKSDTKNTL